MPAGFNVMRLNFLENSCNFNDQRCSIDQRVAETTRNRDKMSKLSNLLEKLLIFQQKFIADTDTL